MVFEWRLKSSESNNVITKGVIEADTQDDALEIINKTLDARPHTGEVLEIIEPVYLTAEEAVDEKE